MIDTAVVVCPRADAPEASLSGMRVAGLPLLARSLLTARQAGVERFVVVASAPQQVSLRAQLDEEPLLQGRVRWVEPTEALLFPADSLLLLPSVLLDPTALRRWLAWANPNGSLMAPEAGVLPLAVPAARLPACIQAALAGEAGLVGHLVRMQGDGGFCRVPWEGIPPQWLRAAGEVQTIERRLIAALRSPEDGPIVDRFVNRPLSASLSQRLAAFRVTPNQITMGSLLAGLLGAWMLHSERFLASVTGLGLFQLSMVLDHVDGEVARLKFQFSRLGKWLDNFSDHVVSLAVIGSLTWRVAVNGEMVYLVLLGLSAAIGVTGAFLIFFGWTLSGQRPTVGRTAPPRLLAPILSALANRDGFCLALWATVLPGHPAWFLWTLALGANAFWLAWLLVYGLPPRVSRQ